LVIVFPPWLWARNVRVERKFEAGLFFHLATFLFFTSSDLVDDEGW